MIYLKLFHTRKIKNNEINCLIFLNKNYSQK